MKSHFDAKDIRTLRLLHEYGFTDRELADHLGLSPLAVRHMRHKVGLAPNGLGSGIARDRRTLQRAISPHPLQYHLGGPRSAAPDARFKFVDDRYVVEA